MSDVDSTLVVCPRCATACTRQQRGAVVVDVCGSCRGMWLDRGELAALLNAELVSAGYRADLIDDGDADLLVKRCRCRR